MKSIFSGLIIKKKRKPKFAWLLMLFVIIFGLGLWWHWYSGRPIETKKPSPTVAKTTSIPPIKKKTHVDTPIFRKMKERHALLQAKKKWNHWGIAPYAHSFAEACRKAPEAIDSMRLPVPVKEHFKKALKFDCNGGRSKWYTPGMPLEQVTSGPDLNHVGDWVMNHVSLAELPVLRSPNGRLYRPGSVAETANVVEWRWTYEGKTYVWFIPRVCFNEGWRFGRSAPSCKTIKYEGRPGDEFRFAVFTRKYLPSACWQLCDGDDCVAPPSPCSSCNWIGLKRIIPSGFRPLYTGRYIARHSRQSLRFPLDVEQDYVVFCDTRPGLGQSDSWVVQPRVWLKKGTVTVHVPYGGQEWPVWGPGAVDWSKFKKE